MVNFFDLAENGYEYFMKSYQAGYVYNEMAVNAASTVEKYLKHIAMLSYDCDVKGMPSWARDHNIKNLLKEMEDRGIISISQGTFYSIYWVKQYLYSARYPEFDDSRILEAGDIEKCKKALVVCRNLALEYIRMKDEVIENEINMCK